MDEFLEGMGAMESEKRFSRSSANPLVDPFLPLFSHFSMVRALLTFQARSTLRAQPGGS